jgi:RNA polymerase sigma-70 factor (ECF subfamily)
MIVVFLMSKIPSQINHATDEELMALYQSGEHHAFETIYQRYSGRIHSFISSRLHDRSLIDDVCQATFMKLHRTRDQYDSIFPLSSWIFTVCRSVMLDTLRSQHRLQQNEESNSPHLEKVPAPETPLPSEFPDLRALSESQRHALELRYYESLSFDEIAKKLNTSSSNVRQLVSRATRKLRFIVKKLKNSN